MMAPTAAPLDTPRQLFHSARLHRTNRSYNPHGIETVSGSARPPLSDRIAILEDNELVIRSVKIWGGRLYKTYRIYEREIETAVSLS